MGKDETPIHDVNGRIMLKRLVSEHKRNCNDPNCTISLCMIRFWLESFGVEFSDEEKGLFI